MSTTIVAIWPKFLRTLASAFVAIFFYQYILIPLAGPAVKLPLLFSPYSAFGMLLVVFFSAAHAWYALGLRNAAVFFGMSVLITWCIEEFGVRTGLIFGAYYYTSPGPLVGHVPVEIPLLWFGLLYLGYALANAIGGRLFAGQGGGRSRLVWLSLLGAAVVMARDAVIEPILAQPWMLGRPWVWEESGAYFGVPVQNFFGWMLTAFIVFVAYRSYERTHPTAPLAPRARFFELLPVLFYAGLMAVDLMNPLAPPGLLSVGLIGMGIPALIAGANIVRRT